MAAGRRGCHNGAMKNIKHSLLNKPTGLMLAAVLLGAVTGTGCVGRIFGWQARVQTMPFKVEPYAFLANDDYTYYPQYETYYSHRQNEYAYWNQGAWLLRPTFTGVPMKVLLASPSVDMTFHDAPANHHAAILAEYPQTWTGPAPMLAGQAQ